MTWIAGKQGCAWNCWIAYVLPRAVSHFQPTQTTLQGLMKHPLDSTTKQSFLIVLIDLAKRRRRLPDSVKITEKTMAAEEVHTSGGFWEIRRGTLNNTAIAIKSPRLATTTDIEKLREVRRKPAILLSVSLKRFVQRFCREVILWNSLSHPNILKLTGVLGSVDTLSFSTVSEWMERDTIMRYLKTNDANRLELVGVVRFSIVFFPNSVNLVTWSIPRFEVYA